MLCNSRDRKIFQDSKSSKYIHSAFWIRCSRFLYKKRLRDAEKRRHAITHVLERLQADRWQSAADSTALPSWAQGTLSTSCLAFNRIIKIAGPERISGVVVRALFWPHFLLGSSQCRSNLCYLHLVARAGGFLHTLSRMQLKEAEESICSNLSHN